MIVSNTRFGLETAPVSQRPSSAEHGVDGRLAQAKFRPLFIEDAVRVALRDAIAWRIGGGPAPRSDAFVAAAIATARLALDALDSDSAERSRTLSAAQRVARRFTRSALYARLMNLPASQFMRLGRWTDGPDAIVRDRRRHLHAIILTVARDGLEAAQIATKLAAAAPLSAADCLAPLTVHVFSLATAERHAFERDVAAHARTPARVA